MDETDLEEQKFIQVISDITFATKVAKHCARSEQLFSQEIPTIILSEEEIAKLSRFV